jgi:hypothetical protein
MRRLVGALSGTMLAIMPIAAWAEGSTAYSRGNAMIYFAAIATVLIYGINDVFHKKWLTWASAVVIPVVFYLNLPAK